MSSSPILGSRPCESCGRELRLRLSKKNCASCQNLFCNQCLHNTEGRGLQCNKCRIFNAELFHRSQLEGLSLTDLRYYYHMNGLQLPSSPDKVSLLIEGILTHQAEVMTLRALEAQNMLGNPTALGELNFVTSQTSYTSHTRIRSIAVDGADLIQKRAVRKDFIPGLVTNLRDLYSEEEIILLPVKILKIILQRNCIDYRGCVEKEELQERVKRLWKAREKQKEMGDKIANSGDLQAENEFLCKICMDEPVDCVLLECGHMLTCVKCGRQLNECPVCRQYVTRVVHAFRV